MKHNTLAKVFNRTSSIHTSRGRGGGGRLRWLRRRPEESVYNFHTPSNMHVDRQVIPYHLKPKQTLQMTLLL